MRRTALLCCALLTVTFAGCASSAATSSPYNGNDGQHHWPTAAASYAPSAAPWTTPAPWTGPTQAPWTTPVPAASASQGPWTTPAPWPTATLPDTSFQNPGTNPYVDAARDPVSTFGLDVDTASFTVARQYVASGRLPDAASIRPEEWVNHFEQGYVPPRSGSFAIYTDGSPVPFLRPDELLLRIGVKARAESRERKPAALTFVIDVSGSMADDNKLEIVKGSLTMLASQLHADDRVAIVAFTTDARVVLGPTKASEKELICRALAGLHPEDTTNAEAGLRLGYRLAREQMIAGGINRVVMASDGVANTGLTNPDGILSEIKNDAQSGIQLVTVGVGMGTYNDTLLQRLADQGDGFYAYVDTPEEARRLFVDDLATTIDTVALDAKAQIEFDPSVVAAYRQIGYENRSIGDNQFRDDNVKAAALGAGHEVTMLYAIRLRGPQEGLRQNDRLGTVSVRWTDPGTKHSSEIAEDIDATSLAASFGKATPQFRLDALVAATAEVLRGSPWVEGCRLRDVKSFTDQNRYLLPNSEQARDFLAMLEQVAKLTW